MGEKRDPSSLVNRLCRPEGYLLFFRGYDYWFPKSFHFLDDPGRCGHSQSLGDLSLYVSTETLDADMNSAWCCSKAHSPTTTPYTLQEEGGFVAVDDSLVRCHIRTLELASALAHEADLAQAHSGMGHEYSLSVPLQTHYWHSYNNRYMLREVLCKR